MGTVPSGLPLWATIFLFMVAFIPSVFMFFQKRRRDAAKAIVADNRTGADMARTVFDSLNKEIDRFAEERKSWVAERLTWSVERTELIRKVDLLTLEVQSLHGLLSQHGITS